MSEVSIGSLISGAADSVEKTRRFINSIRGRPEGVDQLSDDLKGMQKPLGDMRTLSNNSNSFPLSIKNDVAKALRPALNSCQQVSTKVESLLSPLVKQEAPGQYAWKKFGADFSNEKLKELQSQVASCKSSLNVASNAGDLLVQAKQSMEKLQK